MDYWGIDYDGIFNSEQYKKEAGAYGAAFKALKEAQGKGWENIFKAIGNGLSDMWNGLTGKTSAQAVTEANERNIENQNYWNEIAMAREDTAVQRRLADIQAAGLNPWLAISGTGAQSTAMSTATAEPEDGSKILSATSAMALLAVSKIITKLMK